MSRVGIGRYSDDLRNRIKKPKNNVLIITTEQISGYFARFEKFYFKFCGNFVVNRYYFGIHRLQLPTSLNSEFANFHFLLFRVYRQWRCKY